MRVAIIGGGLGGLAAAAFLMRAGFEDVRVYEQSPELGEVGAGIHVPPNAITLLRRLGIQERLEAAAVRLEVGWELRRWKDGRILYSQRLGSACEERFGAPYYVAHRAGLLDAIRSVVPDDVVALGRRCVAVRQEGQEVHAQLADGEIVVADVLIGADGIHSAVRDAVTTPTRAMFSGTAAYRCLIPADAVDPVEREPVFKVWLGPGRHLVQYPVSRGREINVVAVVPAGEWRTESWVSEGTVEGLLAEFEGWAPAVGALLSKAPKAYLWALYDREPLPRIVRGRIALLGDAAHPMLPFLAQGAAQAFEDAAALALCLRDGPDAEAAIARYEDVRLERVSEIQRGSRSRAVELNHLPDGPEQAARDAALAGQDRLEHLSWLYEYDAEEAVTSKGLRLA